jgi:hypothetical protein
VFKELLTVFKSCCVLGPEEIGRTRCVRSATDCNYQLCVEFLSAIKFHRE